MFQFIGYNLKNDTLIATNNATEWALTCGHIPQECEYFTSLEDFISWRQAHPFAH